MKDCARRQFRVAPALLFLLLNGLRKKRQKYLTQVSSFMILVCNDANAQWVKLEFDAGYLSREDKRL